MTAADLGGRVNGAKPPPGMDGPGGKGFEVPPPGLRALDARAFLALDIPPRDWLLEPVLPAKGLGMLHAPRGIGKTHVALGLAYAVAGGGTLFRWKAARPSRVLYVDGEMPARTMQERLAAVVASGGSEPPPGFLRLLAADLHEDGLPDLMTPEGQRAVEAVLDGAELLILDNLSALCRSGRENEADDWQSIQDFLLRLRRRGVAVLMIHHSGKGGQQRGTSRREDLLDTVVALRRPQDYRPREGARFEVHVEKARGVAGEMLDPFEAVLEMRDGGATWTVKGIEDAQLARVAGLTNDGLTVREIEAETGIPKSRVNRMQKRAKEEGKVVRHPERGGADGG